MTPREQKAYNDALKETQSLNRTIASQMDNLIGKSDKRNKLLSNELNIAKDILNNIESQEDVENAINKLTAQRSKINNTNLGVNNKLKSSADALLTANIQTLKTYAEQQKILGQVQNVVEGLSSEAKQFVDDLLGGLNNIPLVGSVLSDLFKPVGDTASKVIEGTSRQFMSNFSSVFNKTEGSMVAKFKSGFGAGIKSAKTFATRAMAVISSPMMIAAGLGLALIGAFSLGIKGLRDLEKAAQNFREETGLLISQTGVMTQNIRASFTQTLGLGASMEDVAKAASSFVNEFDGIEQPAQSTLTSMVTLNKNFGIGVAEASKLNKVFQNIGGLTQQQSQFLIGQTVEMAKMANVAPSKVIKDMADNAGVAYEFFGGSPKELAKAAVEAAKLGTSIGEAANVSKTLLDFESSVAKELEASSMLGTNLNLSRARQLAADNDIVGAQQEIISQLNDIGDINDLNLYQKEALVAATGMELSSLVNQQRIAQKFGKLDKERLAAANALLEAGKDISEINSQDLKTQSASLAAQKSLQDDTTKLQNAFGELGGSLKNAFMPLAEFVMPILSDMAEILGDVLVPVFNGIGSILKFIQIPLTFIFKGFFALLKPISKLIRFLTEGFFKPLNNFNTFMQNGLIKPVNEFAELINTRVIAPMKSFFDKIGQFASFFMPGAGITTSAAAGITTETTSVQDAVISPDGGIISTSPEDYLIATKNPSALASGISGGGNMDVVVNELRELKQAFLSNKDVYMDTVKVTSQVSKASEKSSDNIFGLGAA